MEVNACCQIRMSRRRRCDSCSNLRMAGQSLPARLELLLAVVTIMLVPQAEGMRLFRMDFKQPVEDLVLSVKDNFILGLQQKTNASMTPATTDDGVEGFASMYIDCGATEDYTDSRGNIWQADLQYSSTSGRVYQDCPLTIHNEAVDAELYCTERWFEVYADADTNDTEAPLSLAHGYEIPVPQNDQSSYSVTLHFAENFYTEENKRVFDVSVEQSPRRTIDIIKEAQGPQRAYTLTFPNVQVGDGYLSIQFFAQLEFPKVSAMEIHGALPPTAESNSTTVNTTATPTYVPGMLTVEQHGLLLSNGLTARILATSNSPATYHDGTTSTEIVHTDPDAGACFVDERPGNEGGWIYVSNSEAKPAEENGTELLGGVGAFTFNVDGQLIDFRMVLNETSANCGGGKTPWGAWISGEERKMGEIWQVDPTGEREPNVITMSYPNPGMFESFAYDARQPNEPHFFMSKDDSFGEFRRFTPAAPDWNDPWSILLQNGTMDYLVVEPSATDPNQGTYYWTTDGYAGQLSANVYFPNVEGIDVRGSELFFVSKLYKSMFVLDLDNDTYINHTTTRGLFDGEPDQIQRLVDDEQPLDEDEEILYFTEDGGTYAGIHARNAQSHYFTILESHIYADETTGLAFSPDSKHLYIAYQDNGIIFQIQRADGLPFNAKTLNVKYHNTDTA